MYRIEFTPEAVDDLETLRKYDQTRVVARIEAQLAHAPTRETRHRKRLRPNDLAEWELRVETFRVFFDVDLEAEVIKVVAVGHKEGNELFIHGERYEL
jgi:mRNA-degrading endonuclease RelE of RelBE toxin-antitoxin system